MPKRRQCRNCLSFGAPHRHDPKLFVCKYPDPDASGWTRRYSRACEAFEDKDVELPLREGLTEADIRKAIDYACPEELKGDYPKFEAAQGILEAQAWEAGRIPMRWVVDGDFGYWTRNDRAAHVAIDVRGGRDMLLKRWRESEAEWQQLVDSGKTLVNLSQWRIDTACGANVNLVSEGDIPLESTPCPCGHPDCWLVRYACQEL